jgi:aryl-alcohol dehydrogenase-like predicted oxidoreductase
MIPGARNAEQVRGIVGTLDVQLTAAEFQTIDQAFKQF